MSLNVLLVEDNLGDVILLREALAMTGVDYHIHQVFDGVEARQVLDRVLQDEAPAPDLIILDLNLPRKNGRTLLGEIAQLPRLRSIPLVVLTSSTGDHDAVIENGYPVECYFVKPPTFHEFMPLIQRIEAYRQTAVSAA